MSFLEHLQSDGTTVCHAWKVTRRDGTVLGFTDHDKDLLFGGTTFAAQTGLTARALQQTTGLSVDNTEAFGALSDAAVKEEDIRAGRYDNAEVTAYLVNWEDPTQNMVLFHGNFGEITWSQGAFQAELRGLSERLNIPFGRVYHAECSAVVGDGQCKVNLSAPNLTFETTIAQIIDSRSFTLSAAPGQQERWFERGAFNVLDGAAKGLSGVIRFDVLQDGRRVIKLWQALGNLPEQGARIRLSAGCDRRAETCRNKFNNFVNFRGFPHIPGEDWLRSYPSSRNT